MGVLGKWAISCGRGTPVLHRVEPGRQRGGGSHESQIPLQHHQHQHNFASGANPLKGLRYQETPTFINEDPTSLPPTRVPATPTTKPSLPAPPFRIHRQSTPATPAALAVFGHRCYNASPRGRKSASSAATDLMSSWSPSSGARIVRSILARHSTVWTIWRSLGGMGRSPVSLSRRGARRARTSVTASSGFPRAW